MKIAILNGGLVKIKLKSAANEPFMTLKSVKKQCVTSGQFY